MTAEEIVAEARLLGLGERFAIWRAIGQDIYGDEGLPPIIKTYEHGEAPTDTAPSVGADGG